MRIVIRLLEPRSDRINNDSRNGAKGAKFGENKNFIFAPRLSQRLIRPLAESGAKSFVEVVLLNIQFVGI